MAVTVHAHLIAMQHALENVQVVPMVAKGARVDARVYAKVDALEDARVDARPIVTEIAGGIVPAHVRILALVAANKVDWIINITMRNPKSRQVSRGH